MSELAAKGKEEYLEVFKEFSCRHQKAITELLDGNLQEQILEETKKNHETLKNLLHAYLFQAFFESCALYLSGSEKIKSNSCLYTLCHNFSNNCLGSFKSRQYIYIYFFLNSMFS